jgi:hypothetical protein
MVLAPYQGLFLTPGMGSAVYANDTDISGIFYGPIAHQVYRNACVVSGASRDPGNTSFTTVLRIGLIMGIITASNKWAPFDNAASDGTQLARGILLSFGLNTQSDGADADRYLATILVSGVVNPSALCIATTAGYGIPRTGAGPVNVRKHFKYNITLSDDFERNLSDPLAAR